MPRQPGRSSDRWAPKAPRSNLYGPYPAARPPGLRRRSLPVGGSLWRIDAAEVAAWNWVGFDRPRFRFDPESGAFRVRYAATTISGAAREKYLDTGRLIPADHAKHYVVHLRATRPLKILDLRTQANLDALDADDRINTGHEPLVWQSCRRLADAVRAWWDELDGIMYRSRTRPQTSSNLACLSLDGFRVEACRILDTCVDELDELVLHHHFTVDFQY
jgi:RES domain